VRRSTKNALKIKGFVFSSQRATAHELQRTMKSRSSSGGLVYSTDSGRMCPDCRQPMASCRCSATPVRAPSDGVVRVSRETKGRAGKGVTLVKGVPLDATALTALGKQLKAACGSGGTVKDGVIEVQGDHCERVIELLKAQGYVVKRAGG
jgi:translation initiation factor 1